MTAKQTRENKPNYAKKEPSTRPRWTACRQCEVFVRVGETGSFTRTAESLHLPKATVTVTTLIQQIERRLGVKVLNRTTRRVRVTADGTAYCEHCGRIPREVAAAEASVSHSRLSPQGRLRVDVGATFGRRILIPALPEFFTRYSEIRLELGCADRPVDLLEEGVGCVVRGGQLTDSSLVARPLGSITRVCCAAPSYPARHGRPQHPHPLRQHPIVSYFARRFGETSAGILPATGNAPNLRSRAHSPSTTAKPPGSRSRRPRHRPDGRFHLRRSEPHETPAADPRRLDQRRAAAVFDVSG